MGKNGITTILNNHYNTNSSYFNLDISSNDLKTVVLKIGETPIDKDLNNHLKSLSKSKKRKLCKFYGVEEEDEDKLLNKLEAEQKKLNNLSTNLENYSKLKKIILNKLYNELIKDKNNLKSIDFANEIGITEYLHKKLKGQEQNRVESKNYNADDDEVNLKSQITNSIHITLVSYIKDLFNSDQEFDQFKEIQNLTPNLAEDIANSLFGFTRKFIFAELKYKKFEKSYLNKIESTISRYLNPKKNNISNVFKVYYEQYKQIRDLLENKHEDYNSDFNLNLHNYIDIVYKLLDAKVFNNESKNKIFLQLNSLRSMFIPFDIEKSYPSFEANNVFDRIKMLNRDLKNEKIENTEICTKIKKRKITKKLPKITIQYVHQYKLFKSAYDKLPYDDLTEEQKKLIKPNLFGENTTINPKGWARKIIFEKTEKNVNKYLAWSQVKKELTKKANNAIKIGYVFAMSKQINLEKSYKLREYASWLQVKYYCKIIEIDNVNKREGYFRRINEIASDISNLAYEQERKRQETQSMYLSDFYNPPLNKDSAFKSNTYLYTDKNKKTLNLALSFINNINTSDNNDRLAIVYTYQGDNDNHEKIINTWKKLKENNSDKLNTNDQLKYFNYDLWNTKGDDGLNSAIIIDKAPIYKYFTKISFEPIGKPEFDFKLQFGRNQSRKYFWNHAKINNKSLVHNIFDPKSRLKISSMRVIKKHNPIKNTWEYYLNLAIYRLENIKEINDNIFSNKPNHIGIDAGDNLFFAPAKTNFEGSELEVNNNIIKHTETVHHKIRSAIKDASDQQKDNNYIKPETRRIIRNKVKSTRDQVAGYATKKILDGQNIISFEEKYIFKFNKDKYQNQKIKEKLLSGYLQSNQVTSSRDKIEQELPKSYIVQKTRNNKPNYNKLNKFSFVSEDSTSKICCNCGSESQSLIDKEKITSLYKDVMTFDDLKTKYNKINLLEFLKTEDEYLKHLKHHEQLTNNFNLFKEFFEIDLINSEDNLIKKLIIQRQESLILKYKSKTKKLIDKDISFFQSRIKWYFGHIEIFRCFGCGNIIECDKQAALNIARRQLFNQIFYDDNNKFSEKLYKEWYKKIEDKIQKLFILSNNISNTKEIELFIIWYKISLIIAGWDNGISLWNKNNKDIGGIIQEYKDTLIRTLTNNDKKL